MAENSPRTGEDARRQTDLPYVQRPASEQIVVNRDQLLVEATELVVRAPSLPDILKELAPRILSVTACDYLKFALYDPIQNCMITHYWKGPEDHGQFDGFAVEDCFGGWIWTHQQAVTIADVESEKRFPLCTEELRQQGVRSYSAEPLTTPGNRFGALGIGTTRPGVPDAADLEFLRRIAYVLAFALENREAYHATEIQLERLQGLVTIGRDLGTNLDLEDLSANILADLHGIIRHDFSALTLLEEDGTSLRRYAADTHPWDAYHAQGDHVPVKQALSRRALETRKAVVWTAEDLARLDTPLGNTLRTTGVQSLVNVPLIAADRPWGTLNLGSTEKNAFSPANIEYLQQVANLIASAIRNASAHREIAQLKHRLASDKRQLEGEIRGEMRWNEIVGRSPALKSVLDYASIVAATDSTVLITGETGTGKERIARSIHSMSRRKERSLIKLNCAAIPTGLLESELFGHEKGAFTGAVSQKIGRLELADKGTLFLDEIGEIALELQPKLLRVLQDQEFERLGGTRTIRVDTRLIAATNRDLSLAVEQKQFRSDLFYRLHVFPLHLPALRERREDIPALVRHFVEKSSARLGRHIETVPQEALDAMMQWNWPGNIRELENFIERSVILSEGSVLRAPLTELRQEIARRQNGSEGTLRDRERDHIIDILRQTRGVLSGPRGASARLGLKRTTLQYKLQKLGISRTEYLD
ncbi:MAG: sigma 54-interacting transcriptional regulator [Acidobacteria bacterium]|nr:sigma 54-interacting transcriptional regulator [Acidobacteriota bacterium]